MDFASLFASTITFFTGVVFGWLIEKLLDYFVEHFQQTFKRFHRKSVPIEIPYKFAIGPIETPLVIIDGDGETAYTQDTIICHYDANPVILPHELAELKSRIARREVEKRKAGLFFQWPGQTTALDRYRRGRANDEETLEVHLWFRPSDWYSHLATSLSLDSEFVVDELTGQQKTVRDTFLGGINWASPNLQPHPFLSNTFGMVMSLVTSDNYLVIVRRADEIGSLPSIYNCAINEGLIPSKDWSDSGVAPDVYKATIRGAHEELNLELSREEVTNLALVVDTRFNMWGMLGVVRTQHTFQEVIDLRRRSAKDKWEGNEIFPVKFSVDTVLEFVSEHRPWSGGSIASTYFALVYEFGKTNVEHAIVRKKFPLEDYVGL